MEEQLITAVYKRKVIWDPADKLRRNSKILKSLWEEVSEEIGIDAIVAKNRWKNLRAYFINQVHELEKPKSGSSGCKKTTSSWAFYNQMFFLKDVFVSLGDAREDSLTTTKT